MKLEEAIEIKEGELFWTRLSPESDSVKAEKLSIEAMKRLQKHSPYPHEYLGGPLPGETED